MKQRPEGPGFRDLPKVQKTAVDNLESALEILHQKNKNVSPEVMTTELLVWYQEWMKKRDVVTLTHMELDGITEGDIDATLDQLPSHSTSLESAVFLGILRQLLKRSQYGPNTLSAVITQLLTQELGIGERGVNTSLLARAMDTFFIERINANGKIKEGHNLANVLDDFEAMFLKK